MIPLHELKAPTVGCAWHEVAALVLDAATAVAEQPSADLSNLATIQLADEGYVVLPHGKAHEWPVHELARLLENLLHGLPAPDALRAIATHHLASPPSQSSFEAFVSELARFERPDRTAILSQLAARAAAVDRSVDGPTALAQLASRVREDEQAGRHRIAAGPTATPGSRRSALAIVGFLVAGAGVAFLALAYFFAPQRPQGSAPQPVVARVRAGAAQLVASAKHALRSSPPEPLQQPGTQPAAAPVPRRTVPKRERHVPASAPDGVVSLGTMDREVLAPEPELAVTPPPAPADPTVYTSADTDVTPAALLRPHLPSQPPASLLPEEVGTLELMVTDTGRVAHVTLISASSRYQERMLVAAAKSWRFQPAMKDGRPVRFRARIRITV